MFGQHEECSCADEQHTAEFQPCQRLSQQEERQQHCENGAGFVDGSDLAHIAQLQRLEVAQPACARGTAGKQQEHQRLSRYGTDSGECPGQQYHQPGKQQYNDCPQRCSNGGIDVLHPDFCQNCGHAGKQGRTAGKKQPHVEFIS